MIAPAPTCSRPCSNDANALAKVLSWLGFFPHRYSGRNMYGAECPAIDASAIALAHAILEHGPDEAQRALLMRALAGAREDSLGRDFVLYFPRFTYQDAE